MLDTLFLEVLRLSTAAGVVIALICLLRLALHRAPKVISYALWAVALVRLLCPVPLEAPWGLVSPPEIAGYTLANADIPLPSAAMAAVHAAGDALNGGLGIQYIRTADQETVVSSLWWEAWVPLCSYLWAAGAMGLLGYGVVNYVRLRRRLTGAVPVRHNVWRADGIGTPFVLGVLRPQIYLPSALPETTHILLHEQQHIRRGDQIWRMLAWLSLCLHWFNPLVWVAFVLSGRDMELSCDEAVMRRMDGDARADYAASLLQLSTGRYSLPGMPLAFGESEPGRRIRNVLRWKRPALWAATAAAVVALAGAVLLIAAPASRCTTLGGANYTVTQVLYDRSGEAKIGLTRGDMRPWCISADYWLYLRNSDGSWKEIGQLEPYAMQRDALKQLTAGPHWETGYRLREVTDAYILRLEEQMFFLAMQTKNGHTLLGHGWEDVSERGQGASDDSYLKWLVRLETGKQRGQAGAGLIERSLQHPLGMEVGCFASWSSARWPALYVEGFEAGPGAAAQQGPHLGYAVFEALDNGSFRLLDWDCCQNAAVAGAGICWAKSLMIDGEPHPVVLCDNPALAKITWLTADGKPQSTEVHVSHCMEIFNPDDTDIRFWDATGAELFADCG